VYSWIIAKILLHQEKKLYQNVMVACDFKIKFLYVR